MVDNKCNKDGSELPEYIEPANDAERSEDAGLSGIHREMYYDLLTGHKDRILLVISDRDLTDEEAQLLQGNGYRIHYVHSINDLRRDSRSAANTLLYGAQCITELCDSKKQWDPALYYKAAIVVDTGMLQEGMNDEHICDLYSRAKIYGKIIHIAPIFDART